MAGSDPARADLYISADIEADGPIPGRYSMLSLGLCVAGRFDGLRFERRDPTRQTFYRELRPISEAWVPEAVAVTGLDRDALLRDGAEPGRAMDEAADWVASVAGPDRPVLVAYPLGFDWLFLYWYFVAFAERGSPFGVDGALDTKTLFQAKAGVTLDRARKAALPPALLSRFEHTHYALDDAIEQADLFANIVEWQPDPKPTGPGPGPSGSSRTPPAADPRGS
jgi:hypothetical protein